jgi:hypothetical protein
MSTSKTLKSLTQRWMQEHPDDTPCPLAPDAARAWRHKRGLYPSHGRHGARHRAELAKYQAAMAEMRAREAASSG